VNGGLLVLVWLLPLLLAGLAGRRWARWLMVAAPLPALLAAALLPPGSSLSLPWLLLGSELGLDATGRVFLLFSALLWLAASLYAAGSCAGDREAARFRVFFLLAMAGNLGLIVAQDIVSFYVAFSVMGLAATGLVAHRGSLRARRAARRYLAWTIAGELLLFVAVVMLAAQHGGGLAFSVLQSNPPAGLVTALLLIGFGIKLALPGLHLWLPQAYAAAPAPAVAVLSGAMIKAGLLGWLRFLPPGDAALIVWGQVLMLTGVGGILFGAALALLQQRPRLVLAYSSISKMGVLTSGVGAALTWPAAAPALIGALALYAAHHALAKGALFLGLGLVERGGLRPWALAGLGFLALALAGAPLTSGALAKSGLNAALPGAAYPLTLVLGASALATTVVMARFLFLVWRRRRRVHSPQSPVSVAAWLLLVMLIAAFPFALAGTGWHSTNLLPVTAGVLLAFAAPLLAARLPRRVASPRPAARHAPPFGRLVGAARSAAAPLLSVWESAGGRLVRALRSRWRRLPPGAGSETSWPLAGGVWLGIGGLLLAAFVFSA